MITIISKCIYRIGNFNFPNISPLVQFVYFEFPYKKINPHVQSISRKFHVKVQNFELYLTHPNIRISLTFCYHLLVKSQNNQSHQYDFFVTTKSQPTISSQECTSPVSHV